MAVKNEDRTLRECLASVRPLLTAWAIVDCGSTDGTRALLQESLRGLPGQLAEHFGATYDRGRREALALAGTHADFLLVLDPTALITTELGFRLPELLADELQARTLSGDLTARRSLLARSSLPWRFDDAAPNEIVCDAPHEVRMLAGLTLHLTRNGSRAPGAPRFQEDVTRLREAIHASPDQPHLVFRLAQCLREEGDIPGAIALLEKRAAMQGDDDEAWFALHQAGVLRELAHEREAALEAFLRAYDARPHRAEPLVELARGARERGEHDVAHVFASAAMSLPRPSLQECFVHEDAYSWRAASEYASALRSLGKFDEALAATQKLLARKALPLCERARIEHDKSLCQAQLGNVERSDRNRRKRARRAR